MKQQPGVMLYFDVREAISQLSYEEKGRLLDAILDYGQHHTEPGFTQQALALIWPFVRKDIHRDAQRYRDRQQAGIRGAQKRWGEEETVSDSKPMANDSNPMAKMPTTSTTPSPSSPSSPTSPAAAASQTAAAAQAAPTAPSALPRTNGSAIPDLVAKYLPNRVTPAEELAALKAQALEKLRALPPDA